MIRTNILIIGARADGGLKSILDIISLHKGYHIVGLIDDYVRQDSVCGYPVLGEINDIPKIIKNIPEIIQTIINIGDNNTRSSVYSMIISMGFTVLNLIHPTAILARDVELGNGITIFAGVIINSGTIIKDNTIINTGTTLDHDNYISQGVNICPGVHTGGRVSIGEKTFVGIGTNIIQDIKIGENVTVGAGSVVIKDIPDNVTIVGVPAKVIKQHHINSRLVTTDGR